MDLNKGLDEITVEDIIDTGIYNDTDFEKQLLLIKKGVPGANEQLQIIIDKSNQLLKGYFIEKEINKLTSHYKKTGPEAVTDYFQDLIGNLSIIASKNKDDLWIFKGYITFKQIWSKEWPYTFQIFEKKYNSYKRDNWKLELKIIGGIINGHVCIEQSNFARWKEKGVVIEPWGFNKDGKMTCYIRQLSEMHEAYKIKAEEIRKKGGFDNLDELDILTIDYERAKIFGEETN